MKIELTEGSETSAYINQKLGNYTKGNLLYSVHGESLKSRSHKILESSLKTICQFRLTGGGDVSTIKYSVSSQYLMEDQPS